MNFIQTTATASIFAVSSIAMAGSAVDLSPGQISDTLSGLNNTMFPEIIGTTLADAFYDFTISAGFEDGEDAPLYQGTLMTRVVRSNMTGMLTFNFRLMNPSSTLESTISHIEISGFEGYQTRVEYRNDDGDTQTGAPVNAERSASGDMMNFTFGTNMQAEDDSKFFFVMLDTEEYTGSGSTATVYLSSGESVSFDISGALPTPGTLGLLSMAGLVSVRRRR